MTVVYLLFHAKLLDKKAMEKLSRTNTYRR